MTQTVTSSGQRCTYVMSLSDDVCLIYGLDWMPLVGGDPLKLGRARACSLRATHYLISGGPAAVLGCCVIPKEISRGSRRRDERVQSLYSAAAMFASAYKEGVAVAVSFVPEQGYWFAAVNCGLVLAQTDRWFSSPEEVDAALLSLKERFPNLQVLRYPSMDKADQPEWLRKGMSVDTCLQRLSSRRRFSWVFAIIGLFTAGVCWAWSHGDNAKPVTSPDQSASALWQQVMNRFLHAHPIHHTDQLLKVVQAWHQAPVSPSGWKLRKIVCEPSSLDWHCAASYQRHKRLALSEKLDAAKPEDWTIEFPDFDHGVMRWKVSSAASLLELTSPSIPLKEWLSYLQSVTPVFESIQVGSGTQINLPAPVEQEGGILSRPPEIKSLKRRMISIKGPLRSLTALKGLSVPVRWRSLQLELSAPVGEGISRSALTVTLMGDVFEFSD